MKVNLSHLDSIHFYDPSLGTRILAQGSTSSLSVPVTAEELQALITIAKRIKIQLSEVPTA